MDIRDERAADIEALRAMVSEAFRTALHAGGNEAAIVDALRAAGALSVSLVADEAGEVVGHVALSPVVVDGRDAGWFGLGPLAVRPDRQRRGIGQRLVQAGLDRLRGQGARGVVVLGEPAYYRRFGFRADPGLRLPGLPPDYFMALCLAAPAPTGTVAYHPAFAVAG